LKAREEEEKIYTKSTESVDDTAEQDAEKCARRKKLKPIRFKGVTPGLKPGLLKRNAFFRDVGSRALTKAKFIGKA